MKQKLYKIGWCLYTSSDYDIEENAKKNKLNYNTVEFWDEVLSSIIEFGYNFKQLLKPFVKSCTCEGHNNVDGLCGWAVVTEKQLKEIINTFEFCNDNSYILCQSSGQWTAKELDVLHQCVYADLEFIFNENKLIEIKLKNN